MTDGIGPVDAGSSDLGIIVIASMRSSLPPDALDKSNAIPGYDNFELQKLIWRDENLIVVGERLT